VLETTFEIRMGRGRCSGHIASNVVNGGRDLLEAIAIAACVGMVSLRQPPKSLLGFLAAGAVGDA
jgi:hypothetical protein